MNPSERQVGGTHYKVRENGVGHWDYVTLVNAPYLEGCATKYISRWKKKNGIVDLEKALHFLEKRLFSVNKGLGALRGARRSEKEFMLFCEDNDIKYDERLMIDTALHWKRPDELVCVVEKLRSFIEQQKELEGGPTSAYVNQDR